jgi:hypothetical protein
LKPDSGSTAIVVVPPSVNTHIDRSPRRCHRRGCGDRKIGLSDTRRRESGLGDGGAHLPHGEVKEEQPALRLRIELEFGQEDAAVLDEHHGARVGQGELGLGARERSDVVALDEMVADYRGNPLGLALAKDFDSTDDTLDLGVWCYRFGRAEIGAPKEQRHAEGRRGHQQDALFCRRRRSRTAQLLRWRGRTVKRPDHAAASKFERNEIPKLEIAARQNAHPLTITERGTPSNSGRSGLSNRAKNRSSNVRQRLALNEQLPPPR